MEDFDGEIWRTIRDDKGDIRARSMWNLEFKRLLRRTEAIKRRSPADLEWLKRDEKGALLHWALAGAPRGDEPQPTTPTTSPYLCTKTVRKIANELAAVLKRPRGRIVVANTLNDCCDEIEKLQAHINNLTPDHTV